MNINKNYARQASRTLSALALLCVLAVQPTLAQSFSGAQAISDNGLIVGESTGTGIIFNAFLLDREGFHDLGTFGGPASVAFSVNVRGDVVGQSDTPDLDPNGVEYISVAFLADRDGVHNLGTLPGFNQFSFAPLASWRLISEPHTKTRLVPLILFSLLISSSLSCNRKPPSLEAIDKIDRRSNLPLAPPINRDLAQIRERGYLVVLAPYNSTTYFIYQGEPLGYEYALLQSFHI